MAASPYSASSQRFFAATPLPGFPGASVPTARSANFPTRSLPVKWYGEGGAVEVAKSAAAHLSGVVMDSGTAVPYAAVRLYYRPTGVLIARARTDASGYFIFRGLDQADTGNFQVVALDPEGGTQYNALVLDRLTPVT